MPLDPPSSQKPSACEESFEGSPSRDLDEDGGDSNLADDDSSATEESSEQDKTVMMSPTPATTLSSDAEESTNKDLEAGGESFDQDESTQESNPDEAGFPSLTEEQRVFLRARDYRRIKYVQRPYGIFGLFHHLHDLRVDVAWTHRVSNHEISCPTLASDWEEYDEARNPECLFSILSSTIALVSIFFFVAGLYLNDWKFASLAENPLLGPPADILMQQGALSPTRIIDSGEWFRLLTPIILHAGLIHLLVNLLALWMLAMMIERAHGCFVAGVTFTVAAIGGNAFSALCLPHTAVSVGASGGIFGLLGLGLADVWANWPLFSLDGAHFPHKLALLTLIGEVIFELAIGLTPIVDNFAHLGGFFFGTCIGLVGFTRIWAENPLKLNGREPRYALKIIICRPWMSRLFAASLGLATFVSPIVLLAHTSDATEPYCKNCKHMSCVAMPFWKPREDRWWNCDDCVYAMGEIFSRKDGQQELDITCPDGTVVTSVELGELSNGAIRRALPSMCREQCYK